MPTPRPFDLVRENLRKIGALPINEYLAKFSSNISRHELESKELNGASSPPLQEQRHATSGSTSPHDNKEFKEECVSRLEQAVESTFTDYSLASALRFDIARRSGDPNGIQCILTIARPDGACRVYESQACHSRNQDAKVQAAKVAVEKGAVDFILHGDVDMQDLEPEKDALAAQNDVPKEHVVEPRAAEESVTVGEMEQDEDASVLEIERACKEWRSGRPPPDWVLYHRPDTDSEVDNALRQLWGAALRVHLTVPRVYATDMAYPTTLEAKAACAKLAIDQSVLHYIKSNRDAAEDKFDLPPKPTTVVSLQEWFDALPRPLPKFLDGKTTTEINAQRVMNVWIAKARGARFKLDYFPVEATHGLFGCVLRLHRPEECRSYFVDALFSKPKDARHAVSLLAIINGGVGEYIQQIGVEVENKISPRIRMFVHEHIFPVLAQKHAGDTHSWNFDTDRDAFGCTLAVTLGSEQHEYGTEPIYRTKADAKAAAALIAAERGLIELLRFRGEPPPADYQSFWEMFQEAVQKDSGPIEAPPQKRKQPDGEPAMSVNTKRRKRKKTLMMKRAAEAAAASEIFSGTCECGDEPPKATSIEPSAAAESQAESQQQLASAALSEKKRKKKRAKVDSTSSISGGVPLGASAQSKSKAGPSTSTSADHPPPIPYSLPTLRSSTQRSMTSQQLPPRPRDTDLVYRPPPCPYPPPSFGAPHPQHYPFTAPRAFPPFPPSYYRAGFAGPPRGEPASMRTYAYGPPPPPLPHHRAPWDNAPPPPPPPRMGEPSRMRPWGPGPGR